MQGQKQKLVTIDWKPDRQSKEPIYAQIVSYISRRISSGDWGSGQTLPSQRKLSEIFGVNRSTIVEAMDELASLGLIESSYGGGTRIASGSWSLLMQDKAPDWQSYIRGGSFRPNVPTVQMVNHLEFEEGIIRMSTGELSPDLMQMAIAKQVLANLSVGDREVHFEFGRSIVAECGELITTVLFNKTTATGRKLVIVDASMTELVRPAMYGSYHNIENITAKDDEVREKYTVVGTACESTDVFDENVTLRRTHRGDLLTIKSAGAYGMSMASRYNLHDLPGAVYSDEIK